MSLPSFDRNCTVESVGSKIRCLYQIKKDHELPRIIWDFVVVDWFGDSDVWWR
jgi:hypothetical protein